MNRLSTLTLAGLLTVSMGAMVVSGCAANYAETAEGAPLARQLTQSDHCGLTAPGLVYVDQADQVDRLANLPAGTFSLDPLKAVDFDREHLLIVGLGQKPTGGYGITLENSAIRDDVLEITVSVRQPAAGTMVSQVLTTPCAVMAISPEHWQRLSVSGEGLNNLTRER